MDFRASGRGPATLLMAALVAFAGCGGDLGPEDVVGINGFYEALTLRVEEGGTLTYDLDQDEAGLFEIELFTSESRTTGRLVASGLGPGGTDLDVNLAGTWRFESEDVTVHFDFAEDVFLEQLTFFANPRQLVTDQTLDGTRYFILLRQVES